MSVFYSICLKLCIKNRVTGDIFLYINLQHNEWWSIQYLQAPLLYSSLDHTQTLLSFWWQIRIWKKISSTFILWAVVSGQTTLQAVAPKVPAPPAFLSNVVFMVTCLMPTLATHMQSSIYLLILFLRIRYTNSSGIWISGHAHE